MTVTALIASDDPSDTVYYNIQIGLWKEGVGVGGLTHYNRALKQKEQAWHQAQSDVGPLFPMGAELWPQMH